MFRIKGSRFRGRHFAGHRFRPARTVVACPAHQVDMDVIVVRGVVPGREHRTEIVAGCEMHIAKEALFLRRAMPSFLHGNPPSVRKREGRDIDCIAERMFGNARAARADHASARIGRDLLDLDDLRAEPAHRRWLHTIAHPPIKRRNKGTCERGRRRQGCGRGGDHLRRSRRTERRRATLRWLVNRRGALRRLIDWRGLGTLRRISAIGQNRVVGDIVG